MTKSRLSTVAKQNITDRASKLANGLLPAMPPVVAPVQQEAKVPISTPTVEPAPVVETEATPDAIQSTPAVEEQPATEVPTAAKSRPERTRRSSAPMDLTGMVNQPVPADLRCTKMIMLTDEHHKLMRDLSYIHGKPMTVVLYNLLEPYRQAFERDKQKGA
ncbi:hypothetical protein GCM10023187_53640 [Nibrella viscosa]|uniref:Uncharacterized protein n=1 Tax=Nibrella viscosa TaxID=1084524 RepID=A0ABP8KYQ5_9BACT